MKVVFISNYLNHHQIPFCEALVNKNGVEFFFIATTPVPEFRKKLGYHEFKKDYVIDANKDFDKAIKKCQECDILLVGGLVNTIFFKKPTNKNRFTFFISERIFKDGGFCIKNIGRVIRFSLRKPYYRKGYLLCDSAYAARDFNLLGCFKNRAFKWGYFPPTIKYDNIEQLIEKKERNSILWAGRFIDWKFPNHCVEIAKRLKADGYDFHINMIGTGELFDEIANQIKTNNLSENISLLGSLSPEQVRDYMEKSEVYLFTSDRREGWGAVLNESMNSGCAVIANYDAGSTRFLISDGDNGLIYHNGDFEKLYNSGVMLLNDKKRSSSLGKNAYKTISEIWNADYATSQLIDLYQSLSNNKTTFPATGPCSKSN